MEQWIFWAVTGGITLLISLLRYNIFRVTNNLDKVIDANIKNKETILSIKGRLDLVENNHNHLAEKFDKLYDAIRDLTSEMKSLTKEISKKKDV
jgi:peptidoglycan hydrolase CwlO-like protein